ncbi:MAG: 4-hydroxy-tetrahydrodipicolinate reductase [Terriglobales bacterium]
MDLILIGKGKMNLLVESLAKAQGHRVVQFIDGPGDWKDGWMPGLVAIDFSVPEAVIDNLERALLAGIPVVIGTTGWYHRLEEARELVARSSVGAIYGANFSIGVNAFYRIVAAAARALPPEYGVFVSEAHHRQKKDAPSGTAGRLAEVLAGEGRPPESMASVRCGAIPGTHTVGFDAEADTITLTHTARSRRGFAEGALLAAGWLPGRRGLFEFSQVFEALLPAKTASGAGEMP